MCLRICENDALDLSFAPWTVEFTEKDILPAGKAQLAVDDGDRLRRANQAGLEMGVSVAILLIMQPDTLRYKLPEQVDNIGLHGIIPVFLNHQGRCRPLSIKGDQPVGNGAGRDKFIDLGGDVH